MNEQPELCALTLNDLPAIARLEQECFSDPWSMQSIEETYHNPLSINAAVKQNGQIVAYAMAYNIQGELELLQIAVAPNHRKQGIAKKLLQHLIKQAKSATSITLEVRDSNAPARALYASLGFTQVAIRKGYYSAPVEDAIIMMLAL